MKKNIALFSLCALSFSQATLASSALVGTWKSERMECKSGAPYQAFTGGFNGSFSVQVALTESDIKASVKLNLKYDGSQSNSALKQIEDSKKQIEQMPESSQKQKYLAEIEKSKAEVLAIINKYKDGVSCELESAGSYSVSGSEISTKMSVVKSTCDSATTDEESKSLFEVKGNTLILASKPEEADGKSCPKGDSQVTIFSRVQ